MVVLIGVFSFVEVLSWGVEVYYVFKLVLKKEGLFIGLGDEGGFVLDVVGIIVVLDLISWVIELVGL